MKPAFASHPFPFLSGPSGKPAEKSETNDDLGLAEAGRFDSGAGEAGSEVVSHFDGRLYVTNGAMDLIDIFDTATGSLVQSIDLTLIAGYDGVNSVSVSQAGIAVAVEIADPAQPDVPQNGVVAVYDLAPAATPTAIVPVGNLPDMVTFSRDGSYLFVANEGGPKDAGNPAGSISVIDTATMTARGSASTRPTAMTPSTSTPSRCRGCACPTPSPRQRSAAPPTCSPPTRATRATRTCASRT